MNIFKAIKNSYLDPVDAEGKAYYYGNCVNNIFLHLGSKKIYIVMETNKTVEPDGIKIKTYRYDDTGQLRPDSYAHSFTVTHKKGNFHMANGIVRIVRLKYGKVDTSLLSQPAQPDTQPYFQPINPQDDYNAYEQFCTSIAEKVAKAAVGKSSAEMNDAAGRMFFERISWERLKQLLQPEQILLHQKSRTILIITKNVLKNTVANTELTPTPVAEAKIYYYDNQLYKQEVAFPKSHRKNFQPISTMAGKLLWKFFSTSKIKPYRSEELKAMKKDGYFYMAYNDETPIPIEEFQLMGNIWEIIDFYPQEVKDSSNPYEQEHLYDLAAVEVVQDFLPSVQP
jgi:hypothetical protein